MRKPSRLPLKLLCFGLYGLVLALFMRTDLNCLIRHFTGVICPGCGMSRAWASVLRLDFWAAFHYHPMFWSVPFLVLYILYDGLLFKNRRLNNWVLALILGGFLVCYIIRLVCFLGGHLAI